MFDEFYGFTGRPFQLTPDPSFYFESMTHRKALSYFGNGLAQGEGFMVITGEVSAGKSTFVGHLMSTIDPGQLTAVQIVTSKLDGSAIVHVVAQAFGLSIEEHDKASALGEIETFLREEARAGRRCLLIVDESQNLTIEALEELRMLSNFQLDSHPLLQTLLLGQPEFRDTLSHHSLEQFRQGVIAMHHLDAMQADEVQQYIKLRLERVGWTGNPEFSSETFKAIHDASGGIPRRINEIADRLLLLGAAESRTLIDGKMVAQVIEELNEDSEMTHVSPSANPDYAVKVEKVSAAAPSPDLAMFQVLLEERDAQIADLQRAVAELSSVEPATSEPDAGTAALLAEISERVAGLEGRMAEQDRTLRHTLTMLIEWVEGSENQFDAA